MINITLTNKKHNTSVVVEAQGPFSHGDESWAFLKDQDAISASKKLCGCKCCDLLIGIYGWQAEIDKIINAADGVWLVLRSKKSPEGQAIAKWITSSLEDIKEEGLTSMDQLTEWFKRIHPGLEITEMEEKAQTIWDEGDHLAAADFWAIQKMLQK
jgi:hypothetical protein